MTLLSKQKRESFIIQNFSTDAAFQKLIKNNEEQEKISMDQADDSIGDAIIF